MGIYIGHPETGVEFNNAPLPLFEEVYDHSKKFNWGYGGSGPAQLALAIFCNEYGTDLDAHPVHYQDFKWAHISNLKQGQPFRISSEQIHDWVDKKKITG